LHWRFLTGSWVGVTLLTGAATAFAEEASAQTYIFVCPDQTEYVVRATGAEACGLPSRRHATAGGRCRVGEPRVLRRQL
jgi:hypothetical protein